MGDVGGKKSLTGSEIAVIGMAGRFPGARDLSRFWQNLCDGLESISFFDEEDLAPSLLDRTSPEAPDYVKAAPILDDVESFAASFFGYTPKEAEIMDPQQRLLLECAWEALEVAGYNPLQYEDAMGVFVGARTNTYLFNLFSNPEALGSSGAFEVGLGNDLAFLSSRIAYKLNLKGPAYSVHTACSTGLVAIHLACQSLLIDECQIALAGSVAIDTPQNKGYVYQEGGILARDAHCRAFDTAASGTVFGSGLGIVVLKRLEDAWRDGDTIQAIIKGTATNNDGAAKASFTAPSVNGQMEVILEALAVAGIDPETISYLEAHGTGTPLGDPIEVRALTKAFRQYTAQKGFCALGSVKTNFGHLDTAAGIASFIKTVLALQYKKLPPTLHFQEPNPNLDLANTPFYINNTLSDWTTGGRVRRAGVSSFGIGGTNAHVILEEAPPRDRTDATDPSRSWQALMLSAKTESALEHATHNLAQYLKNEPAANLADVAYTLQVGRQSFKHRRFVLAQDKTQAIQALTAPGSPFVFTDTLRAAPNYIVFMFSGQGAQHVNMAAGLYAEEPLFRQIVDYCAEYLQPLLEVDLRFLLYPTQHPAQLHTDATQAQEKLHQTWLAQPILFVIQYALAQLWLSWEVQPQAMIGHSIGEYVAACLSGVFSVEDALTLIATRGRLMQQVPSGSMTAVSLSERQLKPRLDPSLSLAAINSPDQCIVSGQHEAVSALEQQLRDEKVMVRRLHTSHAFHSAMMEPILDEFEQAVSQVNLAKPDIPFISNVTGSWATAAAVTQASYWRQHLRQTVRLAAGFGELLQQEKAIFLDLGPGRTLSRLVRGHPKFSAEHISLAALRHAKDQLPDMAFLLQAVGKSWLAGLEVNWSQFYAREKRHRIPLPTYPFERQKFWIAPATASTERGSAPRQTRKNSDITEWFYLPSWKRTGQPQQTVAERTEGHWLVFAGESDLDKKLLEQLKEAGYKVTVVYKGSKFAQIDQQIYSINPGEPGDYHMLLQELGRQNQTVEKVIHLWSVTTENIPSDIPSFQDFQRQSYYSLLYLAQALAQVDAITSVHMSVIANGLYEVHGETIHPEKAPLLAPCIVVPQETPHITCTVVDIPWPGTGNLTVKTLTKQLITETLSPAVNPLVAYRGKQRWVRHYEPLALTAQTLPLRQFRDKGVYLITGGLGGIGLILAEYLAQTYQAKLILTGRSAFPPRERWPEWFATHDQNDKTKQKIETLLSLEASGAELFVAQADVTNEAEMYQLLATIDERFGQLNGVLHAAGITSGDSLFQPMTAIGTAASEEQFQPKVYGLYVLEQVLKDREIDFCLLFSSNAAVLGGLGFMAYTAANLFMDAFVVAQNQTSAIPWISANWDHWPEETKQYTGVQTSMEQYTMTRAESVEAFRRVVCLAPPGQTVVSTGDLDARFKLWVKRQLGDGAHSNNLEISSNKYPRPHVQTTYVEPRNEVEQTITGIWQEILGIERIGIYDNFFELGGHSLLASLLIAQIRDALNVDLSISQLFEAATVADIAEVVLNMQTEQEDQEKREILEMLAQLSDGEVEQELNKRINYVAGD